MALTKVTGQVINTSTDVTVGVLTVTNTLAVGGTVSIGGTLTYEDVTNIDSVGLITARNGIVVGSGITLSKDGDVFFTGIATGNGSGLTALNASNIGSGTVPTARLGSGTASSSTFLRGDSTFAAVTSTTINNNAANRIVTGSDTADTLEAREGLTFNSGSLKNTGSGFRQLLVGSTNAGGVSLVLDGDSNGDATGGDYAFIEHDQSGDLNIVADNPADAANIVFKTNSSTERYRIKSDGKLMAANPGFIYTSSSSGSLTLAGGNTNLGGKIQLYGGNNSGSIRFHAEESTATPAERARITAGGSLLIGTTTENGNNLLYIVKDHTDAFVDPGDSIIRVENSNSSGTTGQASISFTSKTTGSNADSAIVSQAEASGDSRLEFWTDTNNGMTEKMSINHDGYVLKPSNVSFCISSPNAQTYSNNMIVSTASANTSQPFHNVGGHWSTSNNEFTAPVSGRYMMTLSFTFWFQSSNATDGWDVAVQRDTGSGYSDVAEYYFAGGISSGYEDRCNIEGIWHLNAGDKIRYQTGGYGGSGYFEQKIFTGYLMG